MLFTIAVVVYYSNRYDEIVGGLAEDTMNDAVNGYAANGEVLVTFMVVPLMENFML